MKSDALFSQFSVNASGLLAERVRMQAIAENIANIHTTRQNGIAKPYQRKEVLFSEVVDKAMQGVAVAGIEPDTTPPQMVYRPGHPDADDKGYVRMPNVELHFEMVDLLSAARAYQANLVAMKVSKEIAQRTLTMGQ
jgi:flagellar basal-body rod protein FlgC